MTDSGVLEPNQTILRILFQCSYLLAQAIRPGAYTAILPAHSWYLMVPTQHGLLLAQDAVQRSLRFGRFNPDIANEILRSRRKAGEYCCRPRKPLKLSLRTRKLNCLLTIIYIRSPPTFSSAEPPYCHIPKRQAANNSKRICQHVS